jgi:hypothetical protein
MAEFLFVVWGGGAVRWNFGKGGLRAVPSAITEALGGMSGEMANTEHV